MSVTLKDIAAVNVVYTVLQSVGNSTIYVGPQHTDVSADKLSLTSVGPKRNSSTYGNRRSKMNMVMSVNVATPDGGTEQKDMKVEIVSSIPVGTSDNAVLEAFARIKEIASQNTLINDVVVVGKTQL